MAKRIRATGVELASERTRVYFSILGVLGYAAFKAISYVRLLFEEERSFFLERSNGPFVDFAQYRLHVWSDDEIYRKPRGRGIRLECPRAERRSGARQMKPRRSIWPDNGRGLVSAHAGLRGQQCPIRCGGHSLFVEGPRPLFREFERTKCVPLRRAPRVPCDALSACLAKCVLLRRALVQPPSSKLSAP